MSRRVHNYKLAEDGMTPVPCEETLDWAVWFEKADRVLAQTDLGELGRVSTVFLGTDHNFSFVGPPLLWETMVFGGPLDPEGGGDEQYRERSWVRAAARHRMTVKRLLRAARLAFPGEPDETAHPAYDALARLGGTS